MPAITSPSTGTASTRRPRCSAPARTGAGTRAEGLAWIHHGGGKELYDELINDILGLNVVGFFAMPMPTQPLGWFKDKVEGPDELQGLKYRTVGLAADLFQKMGLAVAQLPGGEILPAMERGVIDAFEFNNPTSDSRFGAQDVAKNYMLGSYHQATEYFEIIFNKDKFDALPAEHQAILEYAAEAASTANLRDRPRQLLEATWSSCRRSTASRSGATAAVDPDAQLKAWDEVCPSALADPFFTKVVESQKAWVKRVVFYELYNAADSGLAYEHFFRPARHLSAPAASARRPESRGGAARCPGADEGSWGSAGGERWLGVRPLRRQAEPVGRPLLRLVHPDPDLRRSATRCSCATSWARRPAGPSTSATSCMAPCS